MENISGNASTAKFPVLPKQANLTYSCYFTDKTVSLNKSHRLFFFKHFLTMQKLRVPLVFSQIAFLARRAVLYEFVSENETSK